MKGKIQKVQSQLRLSKTQGKSVLIFLRMIAYCKTLLTQKLKIKEKHFLGSTNLEGLIYTLSFSICLPRYAFSLCSLCLRMLLVFQLRTLLEGCQTFFQIALILL